MEVATLSKMKLISMEYPKTQNIEAQVLKEQMIGNERLQGSRILLEREMTKDSPEWHRLVIILSPPD